MSASTAVPGAVHCFCPCYSKSLPLTAGLDISTGRTLSQGGEELQSLHC